MQQYQSEFLTLAIIHFLAVASPGPDFAIAVRQSISHGRRCGLWTSVGIGLGVLVHVSYCLFGLGVLISKSILAFNIVKYIGAFYLIYIGLRAVFSKAQAKDTDFVAAERLPSARKAFLQGFVTNALNPKATLFFLAVFSVTISPNTPVTVKMAYALWMVISTTLWFSCLSLFFSKQSVRNVFQRFGHWFERAMGLLLIALGVKLSLARID